MKILHLILDGPTEQPIFIPFSAVERIEPRVGGGCIVNGFVCVKPDCSAVVAMLEDETR